jgi:hypothetical protein
MSQEPEYDLTQEHIQHLSYLLEVRQALIREYAAHSWRNRRHIKRIVQMRRQWLALFRRYFPDGDSK